ncbi:UNVERIFIED_CONTAM: hypothetical protein Sradi_5084600 [Sesamum radiatum]|uniref:DUF659 domain-containing protein n=1 Tax=Sesamum radiatum TaxID=300843 RepID=A0AAW2M225_SESRA
MKQHLAGDKENVASCKKVPPEIRFMIQGSLKENVEKAKEKRGSLGIDEYAFGASAHEFSYDDYTAYAQKESHKQQPESSKKKAKTELESFFKIGTRDPSQPTIKVPYKVKKKWHDTDMAIALWFYDSCIPLNAFNSPFFQIAMSKVASMGHGYAGPSYHALRVSLLKDAKKQVALIVDSFRTHCVNLILKDIGELSHVKDCAILASKVTCYIYNNKWPLNWLRQREGWTEILRPGDTRFATTFIALKSSSDHKDDLQAMVTCQDFKKFLKKDMAKQVKQVVLDERFWNSCNIIVRVGTPLVRLLRICDSDEKSSLGKRPYDPVDYECIDKSKFWIVEENSEGELDYDKMEELLEEEMPRYDEESSFDPETNDVEPIAEADLEQFGRKSRSTYYSDNENEDDWD